MFPSSHKHIAIVSVAIAVFTVAIAGASGSDGLAQTTTFDWANNMLCQWTLCPDTTVKADTGDRPITQPEPPRPEPTQANPGCSNGVTFNCMAPKKPRTISPGGIIETCTVGGVQGILYWCGEVNPIDGV